MRTTPLLLLGVTAAACSSPDRSAPEPAGISPGISQEQARLAARLDLVERLAESLLSAPRLPTPDLMNELERLLPAWQSEQRRLEEEPLEALLTVQVVTHFEQVLQAFRAGSREHRLVAAWALGFSRVPPNDRGLGSPHPRAVEELTRTLEGADEDVLRNALLALWKLGDPATPVAPLLEILTQHHDADIRANAALALGTVLDATTAPGSTEAVLAALADSEPRVRLHAAAIARRFPAPATTARIASLLRTEETPLVRASMAAALGAARSRAAAPILVEMLSSPRAVEALSARQALAEIFGVDHGPAPADWSAAIR